MIDTSGLVIGELAVRENLITRAQLEEAVTHQEDSGYKSRLGEILVEKNALSSEKLNDLLVRQKEAITEYEKLISVSGLFGRIAVDRGLITEKQLAVCIRTQLKLDGEGDRVRIGQVMLQNKLIAIQQFWEIIHAQGSFKCGACNASLENPGFDENKILCEKCGLPALVLEDI